MATTYDLATDVGRVRLLLNDVAAPWALKDEEVQAFLDMESGSVKRAAAQAIDTNADNQVLASKVITTQDVAVDGSKVAAALHARAEQLRAQALVDEENTDDGFYFDLVDLDPFVVADPDIPGRYGMF